MIFATIGTQLPFPRLMQALEVLAPTLEEEIVAQAGPETGAEAAYPSLDIRTHLAPVDYDAMINQARVIVAHAGIGTVMAARAKIKPLILLPRRFALGEHRNDHQIATAKRVEDTKGIYVAWEAANLEALLRSTNLEAASDDDFSRTRNALTSFIRDWIAG